MTGFTWLPRRVTLGGFANVHETPWSSQSGGRARVRRLRFIHEVDGDWAFSNLDLVLSDYHPVGHRAQRRAGRHAQRAAGLISAPPNAFIALMYPQNASW